MATVGSAAVAGAAWVLVAGGFYALSRAIFGRISARRETQLRELISRLADQVRDAVSAGATARIPSGKTAEGLLARGAEPGGVAG